jgi:hypothetical protein
MSTLSIQPVFPIFTDIDGQPLDDGYIFIGVANLQPIGNPINAYWDAALTIPAAQPIRTISGYPANAGTPGRLYVNSDYSIQVQNKNGTLVYSAANGASDRFSSTQISFIQAGTGAVTRTVQNRLRETVSAKDFGAVGDGVADDTVAIQNASDAANAANKRLYVPAGTYKLTSKVTFRSGLIGDGKTKTKFQAVNNGTVAGAIIDIAGSGVYEQFWVDGAVSADPVTWNNSNYDAFTGWIGIYVVTNDVQVKSVRATNTQRAGFNTWDGDNISFYDCEANRARGNFGDCFFVYYGATNISFINCRAYDFTRIGFVFDGTSPAAAVSRNCVYINCHAEYGHDRSSLYGGGEFNSGFWAENCAEVTYESCTSINTGERGFTVAAGAGGTATSRTPNFVFNACFAETNNPPVGNAAISTGFALSGLNSTHRASVVLNACSTKAIPRGFGSGDNLDAILNNCAWYYDGGTTNIFPLSSATGGTLKVNGFYQYWDNQPADVTNTSLSNFTASVSAFNLGGIPPTKGIEINDYKTHDGSPCYIKQRIAASVADENYLIVRNSKVQIPGGSWFSGNILFENCEILGTNLQAVSKKAMFIGCKLSLINELFIVWNDELESCVFDGCALTRSGAEYIYLFRGNGTTNRFPRFKFNNCSFIGDVEINSYFVRQNADSPVFNQPGQGHVYTGCVFRNTGGATSNPLVKFEATSGSAGSVFILASWKSSNVSNVVNAGFLQTNSSVIDF